MPKSNNMMRLIQVGNQDIRSITTLFC